MLNIISMTMLLGIKLKDRSFLSADTRLTLEDEEACADYRPNVITDYQQKIEIISGNLIIAVAGYLNLATEIVKLLKDKKYQRLSFVNLRYELENYKILDLPIQNFIKRYTKHKIIPKKYPNTIIIFTGNNNDKVDMFAVYIKIGRIFDTPPDVNIKYFDLKDNNLIVAGQINSKERPVEVISFQEQYFSDEPKHTTWRDYVIATDKIFETALNGYKNKDFKTIGGKTTTIKNYFDKKNNFRIEGLPGYKTIIHEKNSYQDVSYVSLMDNNGRFYLRDIRKDGRIISNIDCSKSQSNPIMRYDSCDPNCGSMDKYYRLISDSEIESNLGNNLGYII